MLVPLALRARAESSWAAKQPGIGTRAARRRAGGYNLVCALALLLGLSPAAGADAPPEEAAVRALVREGRYTQAVAAADAWLAQLRAAHAEAGPVGARALSLGAECRLLAGAGADPVTLAQARRARDLVALHFGAEAQETAAAERVVGRVLQDAGDAAGAVAALEHALAIRRQAPGTPAQDVAQSLDDLADALLAVNRYAQAESALDEAAALQAAAGDGAPALARTLELRAFLERERAGYDAAETLLEQALALRRDATPGHPDLAATLNALADVHWFHSRFDEAAQLYEQAIDLARATLGNAHPALAVYLANAAAMSFEMRDLERARQRYDEALQISLQARGPEHPDTATRWFGVAHVELLQGDLAGARDHYRRALDIFEQRPGHVSDGVAAALANIALVDARLQDFQSARAELQEAERIWTELRGAQHPFVAFVQEELGRALLDSGHVSEARAALEQALAIRDQTLAPSHVDLATTRALLGEALLRQGDAEAAERLLEAALATWSAHPGARPDDYAHALVVQAEIATARGRPQDAQATLEHALGVLEPSFGAEHPSVLSVRNGLLAARLAQGDTQRAFEDALRLDAARRENLRQTVRFLSDREALRYAARRSDGRDTALALLMGGLGSAHHVRSASDAVMRARALVLDEMAGRRAAWPDHEGGGVAKLRHGYEDAARHYANLVVHGSSGELSEALPGLLDRARRRKDDAERALARASPAFQWQTTRVRAGVAETENALPERAALVSFVRYRTSPTPAGKARPGGAPDPAADAYLAFVLRRGKPLLALSLGAAGEVDERVRRWRTAARDVAGARVARVRAQTLYDAAARDLRRAVWAPLEPHLRAATRVFIVPDGTLHLVNFAALPAGGGRYLVDDGPTLHTLSSERDLLPAPAPARVGAGLVALGAPDFDALPPVAAADGASPGALFRGRRARCERLPGSEFEPLPGTGREIEALGRLWRAHSPLPPTLLSGPSAQETAFKLRAPGHRFLHLATHAYFLGDACAPEPAGDDGRQAGALAARLASELAENPLLLSGLVLAGANRRGRAAPGQDDGILTAEEVAALDLRGVDWAVLSACETGLGRVQEGEGVLGLQRAFRLAGARTVIMSLWAVDDDVTVPWMSALYRARLESGRGTADAVRDASRRVLDDRRRSGASTHPAFWAGFVAAGDWR